MLHVSPHSVAEVMGGESVLGMTVATIQDLEKLLLQGLPKAALRSVAYRVFPNAREARATMYTVVPESTFKRRTRLSVEEGERSERMARVVALAEHVWGELSKAHCWLRNPHALLEGRTPLEASTLDLGARQVEEILLRIEYGLPG